ncbi:spore coat associated protein CotJA [Paenibacillus hexagrammi]|uniref:Spore coat associated protein CotJA n=1 Tax=Paenibacillus hexagrammi TaxID=2908839 RepID=A0ABY3SL63_9BACL|nr:spore coat associated protein CotJA [Paenibacillus sp. YPD9-1]UJF34706.1 spore coat associated protein CotJA [Paenibacillus sp. YPD9-1]
MHSQFKEFPIFAGPFDPCPPIGCKYYNTPPQLYMGFQPPGLPQFSPYEALKIGTLWPALFGPYEPKAAFGGRSSS